MGLFANPVLTRELRGRIRGNRAMIILVIYLSIIAAVTLLVYAAAASSFSGGISDPEAGRGIGKAIFITVMTVSLVQVCVITPSLTAGTIAGEKERQSYDLLITTLLSPLQIVLGKLASAIAFALLLIMAALPMGGIAFLFGGVSGTELMIAIIGLIATAISYAAIGLFWSAVMRTTLAATVMAQGTVVMILLIIPFLFVVISLIGNNFTDSEHPLFVYTMGLLLSSHPFIALGITAAALENGESAWIFELPSSQGMLLVPSPWLVYVVITMLITGLCLFLATRWLVPVEDGPRQIKKKPVA